MAVTYDEVSEMLGKIGSSLNLEEIASFPETTSWMIAVDDKTEQAITLDYM